tara:strand:+ start:190 stop:675 length:486 start_codon:yes stop_codon:yes gene_type:complete
MKKIFLFLIIVIKFIFFSNIVAAKVVGDKIIIGSVISLTGKKTTDSLFFKNQLNESVKNINNDGGIKVGGKYYNFEIIYYDDESNIKRANQLIERLILNEGVQFLIVSQDLELFNETKDIIKKNDISITTPTEASLVYKNALETVDSVDSKKIREYLNSRR